jgi:predicted nuclease with RNAse H fold
VGITAGIDLAAQAKSTGICELRWVDGGAIVQRLGVGASDDEILEVIGSADKVGIDVPLGWPIAFVKALASYGSGQGWVDAPTWALRLRATDRYVTAETGAIPLSVAADKIAAPAMRAASLAARIPDGLDRTGAGRICEVYPAAALRRWGFDPLEVNGRSMKLRYKGGPGHGGPMRALLVAALRRITSEWLFASDTDWSMCVAQDDALDALLCALIARVRSWGKSTRSQFPWPPT